MKIGLMTLYYNNTNYGGQLQAYALQTAVSKLGHNVAQISFDSSVSSTVPSIQKDKKNIFLQIKKIPKKLQECFFKSKWMIKRSEIDKSILEFSEKIPHTVIVNEKTIKSIDDEFDAYICGSDQVWNPGCQNARFFNFAEIDKVKMSYAASLGKEMSPKEHIDRIANMTQDFQAISVRESCHKDMLNVVCKVDVKLVPDPVFLLTKEQWSDFASENKYSEKYIFAYLLGDNIKGREQCKKLAKDSGYRLLYIPYLNRNTYVWDSVHKLFHVNAPKVEEFVSLIKNAEMIITDSFHGTAFSIIFGKKVVSIKRYHKKDRESSNSRIDTLFQWIEKDYERYSFFPKSIDQIDSMSDTEKRVKQMRQIGLQFLKDELIGGVSND